MTKRVANRNSQPLPTTQNIGGTCTLQMPPRF